MKVKKILAALAFGATTVAAGSAYAAPTWTVTETVVPGVLAGAPALVVDNFNFNYSATVTQPVLTPVPTPFSETGYIEAGGYFLGATSVPASLNASAFLGGYGMYGVFSISGTAALVGAGAQATFTSASVSLYVDPNQDTTKTLPATSPGAVALGLNGDDLLVGTASLLLAGEANIFAGLASGDFEVLFGDWALTPFGSTYWTAPAPFYMVFDVNGNTQSITPTLGTSPTGDYTFDGAGRVFFAVPEPGSLVLTGVALLALGGFASRRKFN